MSPYLFPAAVVALVAVWVAGRIMRRSRIPDYYRRRKIADALVVVTFLVLVILLGFLS